MIKAAQDYVLKIPWLTVVIPSYNGERWIDATLASLAAESVDGIDIILVDGSPTTETLRRAELYSDKLCLRLAHRVDLTTWQAKTNVAVDMARSDHICWLGVDDVWLPGRAGAVASWIEAARDVPLHLAPAMLIDRIGKARGKWRCPLPSESRLDSQKILRRLLVQNFICAPAPVFRRDAWLACGGLDETLWYTADWDMWLKLASHGPVIYHDAVTVGFRIHNGSLTISGSRKEEDFSAQMQAVLARHIVKIKKSVRSVERVANASIVINTSLATASRGQASAVLRALVQVLKLGPIGAFRYVRDSRIVDRVMPRLILKLAGGL